MMHLWDTKALGEVTDCWRIGCQMYHRLEEEPGVGCDVSQGGENRTLNPGHRPGHGLGQDLPKVRPAGGGGNVDNALDAARSQKKQGFGGARTMLRYQCDGGNTGELADKMGDTVDLLGPALLH